MRSVDGLSEELRKFNLEDLKKYDGQGGKPAYIAYKGKVYDVSESSFWIGGDHLGAHQAAKDLTEEIELAPHSEDMLGKMKIVGVLI
jgi:predicted heme/steroid binding protein